MRAIADEEPLPVRVEECPDGSWRIVNGAHTGPVIGRDIDWSPELERLVYEARERALAVMVRRMTAEIIVRLSDFYEGNVPKAVDVWDVESQRSRSYLLGRKSLS